MISRDFVQGFIIGLIMIKVFEALKLGWSWCPVIILCLIFLTVSRPKS